MDEKRGGGEETKVKGHRSCQRLLEWQASGGGGVLISSFLPSLAGQGFEQRCFM